jgi:hypothetical protein
MVESRLTEEQMEWLGTEAEQWRLERYPYSAPQGAAQDALTLISASNQMLATVDGWRQGFSVGWISAYERYEVSRLQREREDLLARLEFVLARTPTEDGLYTFPDGESWSASQALR